MLQRVFVADLDPERLARAVAAADPAGADIGEAAAGPGADAGHTAGRR